MPFSCSKLDYCNKNIYKKKEAFYAFVIMIIRKWYISNNLVNGNLVGQSK